MSHLKNNPLPAPNLTGHPRRHRLNTVPLIRTVILAMTLLFLMPVCVAEISVEDDAGNTLRLETPARRIISLAPNLTELIYSAGAGDRLVGTVSHSDYPAAALTVPRIGDAFRVDLEAVILARPDLVLAWQSGNPPAVIEQLRTLDLPVYLAEPATPEAIAGTLKHLGQLAGTTHIADMAADRYLAGMEDIRREYMDRTPVRVFYQHWHRPMYTVNGRHLISRIITLCGGVNLFADLPDLSPAIDIEAVIAADPDVIIASGSDAATPDWLEEWRNWPQLSAVAHDQIHVIEPDLLQRQGVRTLEGAMQVCAAIEQARRAGNQSGK